MTIRSLRYLGLATWSLLVPLCVYLYLFRRSYIQDGLQDALSTSMFLGYTAYLILGCVRGFTLIPSTNLVLLAVPFFAPWPLFVLTLFGILISSVSIYFFSESLNLDEYFEGKHKARVDRMKVVLQRNPLPIIIGWSFFPLAPTDLICYVCGILKVNFLRFVLGVLIGEGTICGIYIFLGRSLLQVLNLR
jgi:uncharacterized membrane protein YdjX (TVP38/TMEM64 family)